MTLDEASLIWHTAHMTIGREPNIFEQTERRMNGARAEQPALLTYETAKEKLANVKTGFFSPSTRIEVTIFLETPDGSQSRTTLKGTFMSLTNTHLTIDQENYDKSRQVNHILLEKRSTRDYSYWNPIDVRILSDIK